MSSQASQTKTHHVDCHSQELFSQRFLCVHIALELSATWTQPPVVSEKYRFPHWLESDYWRLLPAAR